MKLRDAIKKDTEYRLKKIKDFRLKFSQLPKDMDLPEGVSIHEDDLHFSNKKNLEDVLKTLAKLKKHLGNYKINSYWIPYNGLVCVRYDFDKIGIWGGVESDNEQALLDKLSNGKCSIKKSEKKTIVCEV